MKINRRLILLVTVPLAVAVTFSVLALAPAASQAVQAHRLTAMVDAALAASDLVNHLQRERASATAVVADQGTASSFKKASDSTDSSVERFTSKRGQLSALPANAEAAVQRIDRSIKELPSLRAQVRSGNSTFSHLAFGYRIAIADLIDYRDGIAQADGVDSDVADQVRAAAAMSRATEHVGQQQVTVLRALAAGGFTPASQRTFEATRLGYTESTGVMFALGRPEWRTLLETTLAGPTAASAQQLEDQVGRSALTTGNLDVSSKDWHKATSDRVALLRSVERSVDNSLHSTVTDRRGTLTWWAVAQMCLVLLTLVGTVIFATRLGRVMISRLRDLRNAAHDVAHKHLPKVMKELSRPGAVTRSTPEEIARESSSLVRTTSEDEIGQVGEAFNAVHYEAVRLAAQQAHSRTQFAETLVGAARRGARLTSVMVAELDNVQRDESDPERMKVLFELDHLAIRMERNTNNLLVLGGYGQGRVRTADVPCSTVIVAAAQQVERFERVDMGSVDASIGIAARVVHDLAHILAELLDNAIKFSPPESQVGVAVWRLRDRAVVQVVDEGVGLTPKRRAELNADLAEPRGDVGAVRFMGLHVVSRLAARHDIAVELRESSGPGVIAEVTLPSCVLTANPEFSEVGPEPIVHKPLAAAGASQAHAPSAPMTESARPHPNATPTRAAQHGPVAHVDTAISADTGNRADATGVANTVGAPRSSPEQRPESHETPRRSPREPAREEPPAKAGGTTVSGLPVRPRRASESRAEPAKGAREGAARGSAAAPSPPKRRDSRQISDVLAAYTQGINRSTSRRGDAGRQQPDRAAHDDDQQRSTS